MATSAHSNTVPLDFSLKDTSKPINLHATAHSTPIGAAKRDCATSEA